MKKINIKGPIVSSDDQWIYDWLGMESTSPSSVNRELPETGEEIEILINSGGGDVYSGSEIYTTLKDYPGKVTAKVVGVAASAASVIAMAGDSLMMSPTAQMMIHNVSVGIRGDNTDHAHIADVLKGHDRSIANAYSIKTGKQLDELLSMMKEETWMTADDAVEKGFADEVMFRNEATQLVASIQTPILPKNAIDKLRAMRNEPQKVVVEAEKVEEIVNQAIEKAMNQTKAIEDESPKESENKYSRFFF